MKVSELKCILDSCVTERNLECIVKIKIRHPYQTIGQIPTVNVKSATFGFDWESGLFVICPEETLQLKDTEYDKKFKELLSKYANEHTKANNLSREVKQLKQRLSKYENS